MPSSDSASSGRGPKRRRMDLISRGLYGSNSLGTATFIGLRALDIPLQYQILSRGIGAGLLAALGLSTAASPAGSALSPARRIVLAMAAGSAAKQIFWLTCLSREEFPPYAAAAVSVYNTLVNSANSLLALATPAGPAFSVPGTGWSVPLPVALGLAMSVIGVVAETASEVQRSRFKARPENAGKLCRAGWWRLARHVNYGGYALWRTGYTLAAGGWAAALVMAAFQVWDFASRSVVVMEDYMRTRYGEQWRAYEADVPWMLFPGVY